VDRLKPVIILLAVIFVLGGTASVEAGEISPILTEQIAAATAETPIRTMVFLRDQVDIRSLDQELREAKASLAERHLTVITALKAKAQKSQSGLLVELAAEKAAGRVSAFSAHWLVNAVLVEGTPEALKSISLHPDVEYLSVDLQYGGQQGADKSIMASPDPAPGSGVSNHLRSMDIPAVWHELGINGTGQVIGIMDSGVEGSHHALADSWRGRPGRRVLAGPAEYRQPGLSRRQLDLRYFGCRRSGGKSWLRYPRCCPWCPMDRLQPQHTDRGPAVGCERDHLSGIHG